MIAGIDERFVENVALTRRFSQTANMLTQDENLVDVTISIQYRIKNLKDFVLNVNDPEASLRQAWRRLASGSLTFNTKSLRFFIRY